MLPQTAIQKGKELEQHICDQIIARGLDPKACRSAGSGNGNREKSDINTSLMILGKNIGIEAKNHKTLHIQEWWRQTEKLELLGREPILVFKLNRDPFEATNCVIRLDTLLRLIKQASGGVYEAIPTGQSTDQQRALQWAIQNTKSALSKLDKLL